MKKENMLSSIACGVLVGKSKAMSVQSIIIGSVIAGVIAAGGLAMLWPAVDKAKIVAEKSTLSEIGNAISSTKSVNGQNILDLVTADKIAVLKSNIQSLPRDLKYVIGSKIDATDTTKSGTFLTVMPIFGVDYLAGSNKIKAMVTELDLHFDGVSGPTTGVFRYSNTCATPNATATGQDCFYSLYIANQGIASGDDWGMGAATATNPVTTTAIIGGTVATATTGVSVLNLN